ncbi:hypothetical protein HHK36_004844 [Tetracentron sinense]|uniref:Uncharacterized protein n=1 Tax=Tetracentron sinense TaxID=13715 RepID=A0A834ZNF6_TETSI|nr:hypothetical protein HHK36_004844 [Tetracentron sinense]
MCIEPRRIKFRLRSSFSDNVVKQDTMQVCLDNLRITAEEQFRRLKKEIDGIKGCGSIRRISSGSELPGFGGILEEHVPEKWVEVDKTLETLKTALNTVYKCVDDVVNLCDASLCEWQQEQRFREELEAMVIRNSLRSLHEEFEAKLWEQRAQFCGSQSINWLPKINELSSLRQELDAISRSLSIPEMGQLPSHLSHEGGEEWNTAIRKDWRLKSVIEDANTETSVREEVYKCVLREVVCQIKEDIEDSYMESIIKQEICGIIFKEAIKDTEAKLNLMVMMHKNENEMRVSLEAKALDREKALRIEKQNKISSVEAKEMEHRNKMESIIVSLQGLSISC